MRQKKWHVSQVFERVQGANPADIGENCHKPMEEDEF